MTEEIRIPMLTSISALPKSGKTWLSMTWPAPIKHFSFDKGATFVRDRNFKSKDIEIIEYKLPIVESDDPKPYAEPIWDDIEKKFKQYLKERPATITFDLATYVWGICSQAITEAKNRKKLLEREYFLPNLKMNSLFQHAADAGINFNVLNYLSPKYVNDKATGELELDGWKRTEGAVDVVLELRKHTENGRTKMITTIKENRFERDMNGKELVDTNYDEIYTLLLG